MVALHRERRRRLADGVRLERQCSLGLLGPGERQITFPNLWEDKRRHITVSLTKREERVASAFLSDCPSTPLNHILALKGGQTGDGISLRYVTLYLTRACNLRCRTCYISAGRSLPIELRASDWLEVIDQTKELGAELVYLLGGEPLLKHGLLERIVLEP